MQPNPYRLDDDVCPVGDKLWAELFSTSELGLPALVATVAPEVRALLAIFCYRRSHLQTMGLAIATTCEEEALLHSGGRFGAGLFAKSREILQPLPLASESAGRRKITLAAGPL